jgi:xanthine dehydrogenase accessory factor
MNDERAAMIDLAARLIASGTPGTLSTLFSARGSTYRPLGSMMVSLPGQHAGGISGGCLEEYVARIGERATRSASAVMLPFSTHPDAAADAPLLGCGGSIEVLVERLTPAHVTLLHQLAGAADRDECSMLACLVRRDGESVSVTREWLRPGRARGAAADREVVRIRDQAARERKSVHRTLTPDADLLVHYIPPITRLVIFGAGDDAKPLCDVAALLGWHVAVVDRRARFATAARFPRATAVFAGDWNEAVDALTFSPRTAVVLMTHDLDDDARVLSLLSGRPLAYVGALGPAHRREWLLDEVSSLSAGHAADPPVMVRGPIGLDLGDRSAAGIAVAVTAEILAALNHRQAQPLDATVAAPHASTRRALCVAS